MTDLTNLIDILDDFMLTKIAEVLPSPLNSSLRMMSARFKTLIEPPKRMSACDLRDLGVQTGCILMLEVARANGFAQRAKDRKAIPWNTWTCSIAAAHGRIDVLAWLHDNGCPWDVWTCSVAAAHGRIDVLVWLHDNGCPWDKNTCACAANGGYLETLKWLHEHGCPWTARTCKRAALRRHFDCLKYAHEHGCPWDVHTYVIIRAYGNLEWLEYVRAHGCPDNGE